MQRTRRVCLGIKVDHSNLHTSLKEVKREMYKGRGFANAPFLVRGDQSFHFFASSFFVASSAHFLTINA
ncbi:hypothetical protein METHB2_1020002 [Candidatus Methylobacter favarea]|uniref:Uncharacterized protein n=1 Tax=Candidatus Methylobacter favarea TaxID=2707345 RepID=A0A8S0WY74_9GAMM|nr:hypothetical protein METHB2_1020002 [Candidatus Methylobacter favarea]